MLYLLQIKSSTLKTQIIKGTENLLLLSTIATNHYNNFLSFSLVKISSKHSFENEVKIIYQFRKVNNNFVTI